MYVLNVGYYFLTKDVLHIVSPLVLSTPFKFNLQLTHEASIVLLLKAYL